MNAAEVVAKFLAIGDAHFQGLESLLRAAEQFALPIICEVDRLQLVVAKSLGQMLRDGAADTGGIDGNKTDRNLLFGGGSRPG